MATKGDRDQVEKRRGTSEKRRGETTARKTIGKRVSGKKSGKKKDKRARNFLRRSRHASTTVRPANLIPDHTNAVNRREGRGCRGDLIKNFREFGRSVDPRGDLQLARSSTWASGRVKIGDSRGKCIGQIRLSYSRSLSGR